MINDVNIFIHLSISKKHNLKTIRYKWEYTILNRIDYTATCNPDVSTITDTHHLQNSTT